MENSDSTDQDTEHTANEGGSPDCRDKRTGFFHDLKTFPTVIVEEKASGFLISFSFHWRGWKVALRDVDKYDEYRLGPFGLSCCLLREVTMDIETVGD